MRHTTAQPKHLRLILWSCLGVILATTSFTGVAKAQAPSSGIQRTTHSTHSIRVDKKSAEAYTQGIELFRNKKYSEAISYFKESGKSKELLWISELRIGTCYFYLEQYRQAARKFIKIITAPEITEHDVITGAHFYYGSILFFENRLDLAEQYLKEAKNSHQELVVKEAEALLKEITLFKQDPAYQATKKYSASGFFNEQLGYDTNADITQSGHGSFFNRVMGILAIDTPSAWDITGGFQYFGFNTLYLNSDVNTFDSLMHGPSAYISYPINPDHSVALNHKLGTNWLSTRSNNAFSVLTTSYELTNTATWYAETNSTWTGIMNIQYSNQERDTSTDVNATGTALGLGMGYRMNYDSALLRSLNVGIKGQYYFYNGSQSEYYELALSGGYLYAFYQNWRGELTLNGRYSFYPRHANQRSDTQMTAAISSVFSATNWLDIGPSLTLETNSSNVDTYRYFKIGAFINANLFRTISI